MPPPFSARAFLEWAGGEGVIVRYGRGDAIFTQGDPCQHVLYIWSGGVTVSARSRVGKEAVVAVLGTGDFFGEGCLAGQPLRNRSAVAITPSAVVPVERRAMAGLLQHQHGLADRFISHVLTRNIRMEEDLLDQLFGAAETRLACTLLRMVRYGEADDPAWIVPRILRKGWLRRPGPPEPGRRCASKGSINGGLSVPRRWAPQDQPLAPDGRVARLIVKDCSLQHSLWRPLGVMLG